MIVSDYQFHTEFTFVSGYHGLVKLARSENEYHLTVPLGSEGGETRAIACDHYHLLVVSTQHLQPSIPLRPPPRYLIGTAHAVVLATLVRLILSPRTMSA